jgi:hypothetical protein
MWESIKNFFGFGKKEVTVEPVIEKASVKLVEEVSRKVESLKKPKSEEKVTAKEIKSKAKKETGGPKTTTESKPKKTRRSPKKKSE